jgi:hypothetical protein
MSKIRITIEGRAIERVFLGLKPYLKTLPKGVASKLKSEEFCVEVVGDNGEIKRIKTDAEMPDLDKILSGQSRDQMVKNILVKTELINLREI